MSELSNLTPAPGAIRKKKRVGRGESSGLGKTAGKGHKGQKARAGKGKPRPGFEGGQMPLARRLPKRGFTPRNRIEFAVVNLAQLESFEAGSTIDLDALRARGLVKKGRDQLKVLAHGDLDRALTVRAHRFSKAAMDKITAAGGQVELIES
ncbi:MAG: 50S ribosomal protein L15 [bacterium]